MPRGLELDPCRVSNYGVSTFVVNQSAGARRAIRVSFEIDGPSRMKFRAQLHIASAVHHRVHVQWPAMCGTSFGAFAGQDVHHAAGQITACQDFGECHGRQRNFSDGITIACCRSKLPAQGASPSAISEGSSGRARRPRRLAPGGGNRSVKWPPIHAAENLLILVRPAGEINEPVNGECHFTFRPGCAGTR